MPRSGRLGFTLIELLTVIAVIGILAAILIPVAGSVQRSARNAKTRALFGQWTASLATFRAEYGYLPSLATPSGGTVTARLNDVNVRNRFLYALSGRDASTPPSVNASLATASGNVKNIVFYQFKQDEFDGTNFRDAFGNTEIVIALDLDGDGQIAVPNLPVTGASGTPFAPTDATQIVRAQVLFYSAGRGDRETDLVASWR